MTDRHEFGCTAYVGRPCICETLRKERAGRDHASHHSTPVVGCLDCEDAMSEARAIQAEAPWNDREAP